MKKRIEEGSKELLREVYKELIETFPLNNNPEVAFDITHALYLGLSRQNVAMFDVVIGDLNKYASFTRSEVNAHRFSALINSIESLKDVVLDYEPKARSRRNG